MNDCFRFHMLPPSDCTFPSMASFRRFPAAEPAQLESEDALYYPRDAKRRKPNSLRSWAEGTQHLFICSDGEASCARTSSYSAQHETCARILAYMPMSDPKSDRESGYRCNEDEASVDVTAVAEKKKPKSKRPRDTPRRPAQAVPHRTLEFICIPLGVSLCARSLLSGLPTETHILVCRLLG